MAVNWFPLWLSLRVAALATLVSLALGLWIAYVLANRKYRGKELLDAVVTLPLVLPPTVLGYYLLVALGRTSPLGHLYEYLFGAPLVFTWQAAVVASTFHAIPLLVKSARAAFETVDRSYEKAARNLGASEWRVFWRVTLPLSLPGVFAAFLFVFIPTLGEFVTPSLVGGASGYMYGNQIVDLFGTGFPDWETGSVLAIFLFGVVTVLTVVFARFLQPRQVTAD